MARVQEFDECSNRRHGRVRRICWSAVMCGHCTMLRDKDEGRWSILLSVISSLEGIVV